MKEQKKSKSLEIVEKQRALVVEKIIEDMKRDGLHWSEPYIADAERTEMKEQKKSKSLEIVEKQRALVVEKIIEDMKRDGLHWSEPYIPSLSPHNPVSGTVYQGGNRFHLGFVGYMRGFTDNRWCTFNQIRDSGWHLKKGAKAALIEKWREFSIKEENEKTGEKEVTGHYLRCVGYWNVFNASEIEGIPAPPVPEHVSDRTAAIAGDLILSSRCPIVESMRYQGSAGYAPGSTGHYLRCVGYWNVFNASEIEGIPAPPVPEHVSDRTAAIAGDLILSSRCPIVESMRYQGSAGYAPGSDRILIAPRETFLSDEAFTRVLLHEMTHSTGHPSALNRGCNTDFGSPEYAQEELVAELGSLFLSADLGIQSADYEGEHYENHVSYLQSWMHALEDDPSYLFKAAAKADKAGTLIIGRYNDVLEKRRDRDVERAPEKVSLKGEVTAMKDAAKSHDEQAKAPEIAVSAR